MDDSGRVCGGQRVGDLRRILQCGANGKAFAPDQVIQRFARHVLHRNVADGLAFYFLSVDVIDCDDVRVIQRRSSLGFLNESLFAVRSDA